MRRPNHDSTDQRALNARVFMCFGTNSKARHRFAVGQSRVFSISAASSVAMQKRVQIALAVLLVIFAGVMVWQVLRLREPVFQGKFRIGCQKQLGGMLNYCYREAA